MRSLLHKEWTLYRVYFIIIFAFMLWVAFAVLLAAGPLSPVLFAVPFVWLAPISMTIIESKNDSDVLINSLPVTRREIVLSKYVILMLFTGAAAAVLVLIHLMMQGVLSVTFFPASPVAALTFTYTGIGTFLAIYLPLYFVVSPRFMLYGTVVAGLLGFIGLLEIAPHIIDLYGYLADLWQQYAEWQWAVILFTVTTILLLGSWMMTVRIYEAKNL